MKTNTRAVQDTITDQALLGYTLTIDRALERGYGIHTAIRSAENEYLHVMLWLGDVR